MVLQPECGSRNHTAVSSRATTTSAAAPSDAKSGRNPIKLGTANHYRDYLDAICRFHRFTAFGNSLLKTGQLMVRSRLRSAGEAGNFLARSG